MPLPLVILMVMANVLFGLTVAVTLLATIETDWVILKVPYSPESMTLT